MGRSYRWNNWNVEHIDKHNVTAREVEYVVDYAAAPYPEQIGDEKWRVLGRTAAGRYLQVIFLFDPDDTVFIIHARDLTDREKSRLRRRRR